MPNVLIVMQKELRDTIRDRRTLLVMVIVPLFLMPLLFVAIGSISKSTGSARYTVSIAGPRNATSLVTYLRTQKDLKIVLASNPAAAVRDLSGAVGIVVPAGFDADIRTGMPAQLQLMANSTRSASSAGLSIVQTAIRAYASRVVRERLQQRGLAPSLLVPIQTGFVDISSGQERGGLVLSYILPLFIVIYAITGGMYTAMDVSAGEKERSTLEALMLTPATRLEITLGKLIAVALVAFLTMVLAISSMVITLSLFPITSTSGGVSFTVRLDPRVIPLIFGLGITMALAFSALELALGILARTFKEAQSYITPLYLVSFLPVVIINSIPGLQPPLALFLVPAVNAVLLFKEALLGQATVAHAIVTMAALLVFAIAAMLLTVAMFSREQVLLKS
jgi:sodium transport system permease protein